MCTDCRDSHARGVYPTQDTSHMCSEVKQEEVADRRIIAREQKKYGRKERGHYNGAKFQTRPNYAKDINSRAFRKRRLLP